MTLRARRAPAPRSDRPVVDTVRAEASRLLLPPLADLSTVALNAAVVCVCWFLLPVEWRGWLFDNLHGRIAFAIILGTWMLSDTTSTNLLGNDERTAVAALRGEVSLVRVLRIKALVLGLGIGLVTAAVGVVAPFRTRSLRWRWRNRSRPAATARWLVLLALPYFGCGPLMLAFLLPARRLAALVTGHSGPARPDPSMIGLMSAMTVVRAAVTTPPATSRRVG